MCYSLSVVTALPPTSATALELPELEPNAEAVGSAVTTFTNH